MGIEAGDIIASILNDGLSAVEIFHVVPLCGASLLSFNSMKPGKTFDLGGRRPQKVRYTGKRRLRGVVFFSGPQQYMWYAEVLRKTMPRRKCPWGATKEIGLFTTPSMFGTG